ncbi:MAG: RNA polymerase sigma factor (sigma-70 family) [Verrucomicrobiales bacterium]|jgi:RNA polymerase sigma factor (sigma-70 family)
MANSTRKHEKILSLPAWLYRVTERQIAQAMRTEKRRIEREQEAVRRETIARDGKVMIDELAAALRGALTHLADPERTLLFLRYFDGHSTEAIGELYGIRPRAAQKRVERAVDQLRAVVSRKELTLPAVTLGFQVISAEAMKPPVAFASSAIDAALQSVTAVPWWTKATITTPLMTMLGAAGIVLLITAFVIIQKPFSTSSHASIGSHGLSPFNPAIIDNLAASGQAPILSRPPRRLAIDDIEGIYKLPEDERETALAALTDYLGDQNEAAYFEDLFHRWTRLDPPRNARALRELFDRADAISDERRALLCDLFSIPLVPWIQSSEDEALSWVRSLPLTSEAERPAFETVLESMAGRDPNTIYAWLQKRTHNREADFQVMTQLIAHPSRPPEDALAWLEQLPEESVRATTLPGVYQEAGYNKTGVWLATLPALFDRDASPVCQWLTSLPENSSHRMPRGTLGRP